MPELSVIDKSSAMILASFPEKDRKRILSKLTESEIEALQYDWGFWSRTKQKEPSRPYRYWVLLAGRGYGKTRLGAEYVRKKVESNLAGHVALISDTAADVRDVMVEGAQSGILAISSPWFRPVYEPSKRRLTWPNGAVATCYAAEAPGLLRGPQHDLGWIDEIAKWKNLGRPDDVGGTAWSNFQMGLRIGDHPQAVITTTPRPLKILKDILSDPATVITRGTSYENRVNLAEDWFREIISRHEGTRLGRQELLGEMVEDVEGALWSRVLLDVCRVHYMPNLSRIGIGVDPPGGKTECGIVAMGMGSCQCKGFPEEHGFVLADRSLPGSPNTWGKEVAAVYHSLKADRVWGEKNFGGDMVENTIRTVDASISYENVTASRGKIVRAEPVAALFEQGKIHLVGSFPQLEDELCGYTRTSNWSPNRLDSMVWAATKLFVLDEEPRSRPIAHVPTLVGERLRSPWAGPQ